MYVNKLAWFKNSAKTKVSDDFVFGCEKDLSHN